MVVLFVKSYLQNKQELQGVVLGSLQIMQNSDSRGSDGPPHCVHLSSGTSL